MNELLKNRVYYSQNREDIILEAFFPDVKKGFYVDVGANDPVVDSVTKLFYDKGWNGINIEPIKHHYEALKQQRPRDITLNVGAGNTEDTLTFNEYTSGDGLSTFSDKIVNEYKRLKDEIHQNSRQYTVQVTTLANILKSQKVQHIHFMKVDVEGFEYEVLSGNDWKKFRPEVICIEANHVLKDWRPLLVGNGYELVFFDGLNEYYVDASTSRKKSFDFVQHVVIDKGSGVRFSDYERIAREDEILGEAYGRLQEALKAKAHQTKLYQDLLAENHKNHIRATIAERALRRPLPFVKYQLKRMHHFMLRGLAPRAVPLYVKEEQRQRDIVLDELSKAKSDKQLLKSVVEVANIETARLERIHQTGGHQSFALRTYMRLVGRIKRLRVKGAGK